MKIALVLILAVSAYALQANNQKVFETRAIPENQPLPTRMPNFVSVDEAEYEATHHKVEYDESAFTSIRSESLKTEQSRQDSSILKAIEHSGASPMLVQLKQEYEEQPLSSEVMTEQEVQAALLTSEDYNNVPDITMAPEANYEPSAEDQSYIDYFIPQVTDGDGAVEEPNQTDYTVQPEAEDIGMPIVDQAEEMTSFLQMNNYY